MNGCKKELENFLERHANNREEEDSTEMKKYERHLMIGALLFALNAQIITPLEEGELYQRYVEE